METKEPKVYKTHDPDYFNKYYREHFAVKVLCPHCSKSVSRAKLPRHIRHAKTCLLARAQAELRQLKGEPEKPPEEEQEKTEELEPPEYPPLDVKWMVDSKTARKI